MQSHLEAALLGHGIINSAPTPDEDFQEDEGEDVDEFIDEECDGDISKLGKVNAGNCATGRTITLQMLLAAGILQPGKGTMSIEYLGQKFVGDLLEDGKIQSQETDIVFASPSAWAIACKRFINPDKKSGCGWASVKHRGKKLDAYKNIWYKKKKEAQQQERDEEFSEGEAEAYLLEQTKAKMMSHSMQRVVVKHNTIANRTFTHDANTMIDCVPFSNLGKIQPFLVSLSTNAALLMDFHCHLSKAEVSGYLAGQWDVNSHNLQITHAFPCKSTKADKDNASQVEAEISKAIDREKLTLVGWYHSHPCSAAAPTLRDVDAQLDYQIRMKGISDNSYTPCIGIIVSPYNPENSSLESNIIAYWVIPPPDSKPNEYGRPMLMSYSVLQDSMLSESIKEEMSKCAEYYRRDKDFINFNDMYYGNTSYGHKLRSTLTSKFPPDSNESLWGYIRDLLGCSNDEKDNLLSIPSVSKSSQLMSNLGVTSSMNPNLLLTSDIANVLFNSGKFPSATSLLGLPDPMAQSTLAANNMFLQTNLFKMQDLLKPLSTSSPITSKPSKSEKMHSALKIPTDMKSSKVDYSDISLLSLKNKLDYSDLGQSLSKSSPKMDYLSDLSVSVSKISKDYSASDLSTTMSKLSKEYAASDLSKSANVDNSLDLSSHLSETSERPPKIPKTDFSTLDLSLSSSKSFTDAYHMFQNNSALEDLSKSTGSNVDNEPMNLAAE